MIKRRPALSLRQRLALIVGGSTLAALFVFWAVCAGVELVGSWRAANAEVTAKGVLTAQRCADALEGQDISAAQKAVQMLLADSRVVAADVRDGVGFVAGTQRESEADHSRLPDWLASYARVVLELPVNPRHAAAGTLRMRADLSADMASSLVRCGLLLVASALAAIAAAATVLRLLQRSVGLPLQRLSTAVREAHQSPPGTRLETGSKAEFEVLEHDINALLDERDASDGKLRAYKSEFDRRVRERTRQLDAMAEEARKIAQQAEGASQAKSDFLARMSHEIRTPLNGVLGMAELLKDSPGLDERHRRFALVIQQSGHSLLQLINDVLDFSKIEAGKLVLDKSRFCLREMVEDSLEILAERAQSKGLELVCDVPCELDTVVFGDSLRLRQILINLVGNALKFTERGEIVVRLRASARADTLYTFEVSDTGIGIEPGACERIFDAFVQADSSSARRHGGTGLGLAICRQLVELMGGTIGVRSTPGTGSTFHFTVPLEVDHTAAREKPDSLLKTTPVLVISAHPSLSQALRDHLRSWGARCNEAASAEEATRRLQHALAGEIELVVLDASLPGTTARRMVDVVRHMPAFVDTPILVLFAGTGPPPAESRGLAGPARWQNKPVRRLLLRRALERLLSGSPESTLLTAPLEANSASQVEDRPRRAGKVLLVEDNPVNREVARAMLDRLGVEADMATRGREALERLEADRYVAVLMDCQMPDMDGYETTRRWRQFEQQHGRARTPIIALTANALAGDAEKCRDAGMDHYLTKPFRLEQIGKLLESCFQGAPAPAASASAPRPQPRSRSTAEVRSDESTLIRMPEMAHSVSETFVKRLSNLYSESSVTLLDRMRVALASGELAQVGRAAHELKSSSANIGATRLARLCDELETAARNCDPQAVQDLVERLIAKHAEVMLAMEARTAASA